MAYATGAATSLQDLVDKLQTFAVANGWTLDEHIDATAGQATIHRADCYVSFRWDSSPSTDLAIYQSLGWVTDSFPHEMTDDSGNGTTGLPVDDGRRVTFVSPGPYTTYHFFCSTSPYYIHVAVEVDSGRYRHFGFGNLTKVGTWDGGEYCYGHLISTSASVMHVPDSPSHTMGLCGLHTTLTQQATLHIQNFEGQAAAEKWMLLGNSSTGGTDRGGEDRLVGSGSTRSGWWAYALGWIPMSRNNAYKVFIPIPVYYRDTVPVPDTWILLGYQPDVAIVNMRYYNPGDTVSFGGDDWLVFPWVRKQFLEVDGIEESRNAGIAYKKIP